MENQPTADPKVITAYNLKQALFSIVIGLSITLIGQLAAAAIEFLQNLPAEALGGGAGAFKYWKTWKYNV